MKRISGFSLLLIMLVACVDVYAKMDMRIAYSFFKSPEEGIYMETYFALYGNSIEKKAINNSLFSGSVTVEVRAILEGETKIVDKFRISLDQQKDKEGHNKFYYYNVKYPITAGEGTLIFILKDDNNADEIHELDIPLFVPDLTLKSLSDVLIVSQIPEGKEASLANFIPNIPRGNYFLDKSENSLLFYTEVYKNKEDLDSLKPFLLRYSIEFVNSAKMVKGLSGFKKIQDNEISPFLIGLNLQNLIAGGYDLVVSTVNNKNDVIDERRIRFYKAAEEVLRAQVDENTMNALSLDDSFLSHDLPLDSFSLYLQYLMPIASNFEQNTIERLSQETDKEKMHRYFLSFWQNKYPIDPQGAWEDYYRKVLFVNQKYKSRLFKGFRTDRGRVYLQFGPPSMIESRPFEPGTYPYEIWQYDQLVSDITGLQNDRVFIFADLEINTNTYRMIHSTAAGETYNERWQQFLMKRDMMPSDIDEVNRPAQSSDWGTRMDNNIIISPSKLGRYNRW